MVCKTIGIDKRFSDVMCGIIEELNAAKGLTVCEEETDGRLYAVVAGTGGEVLDAAERAVYNGVLRLKLNWLLARITDESPPSLTVAALALALLFFEEAEERPRILQAAGVDSPIINVDGIFNFSLADYRDNWEEAVSLASNLIALAEEKKDILSAATYLTAPDGDAYQSITILIYNINNNTILKNVSTGVQLRLLKLFDDFNLNVLATVLYARPNRIILSGDVLSDELIAVLKHFAKIKKATR